MAHVLRKPNSAARLTPAPEPPTGRMPSSQPHTTRPHPLHADLSLAALFITLLVMVLTVPAQAYRSAVADPLKTLRYEQAVK